MYVAPRVYCVLRLSESNLIPKESFWIHHDFTYVGIEIRVRIESAVSIAN